jgi:hypothetical protein
MAMNKEHSRTLQILYSSIQVQSCAVGINGSPPNRHIKWSSDRLICPVTQLVSKEDGFWTWKVSDPKEGKTSRLSQRLKNQCAETEGKREN